MRAAGFLFVWALILFTVAAAVYGMAGDGSLLAREMLSHAPPEKTGLPVTEYEGVCQMTAAYLTGQEELFQYTFSDAEGRVFLCFQDHEADHMADCRGLIRLAGNLRWAFGGLLLILAGVGILYRKERKPFAKGMLWGLAAAGVLSGTAAAWALTDFDGFFTAFHRLAFTNEGWLLDTRTDLLIRLMPTDFFIALGVKLAAMMAAAVAAAAIAARFIIHHEK